MKIQELFVICNANLQRVIDVIEPADWDLQLPDSTTNRPTTLREAVNYHAYDDAWVPDVLAGKTIAEVGTEYDVILTSEVPKLDYITQNLRAVDAVSVFSDADLDKIVHLSYGDFPAREYLLHISSFRGFRIYDIAKLLGLDTTMPPELVAGLLEHLSPVIETYRQMGVFPPAVPTAPDASPQVKLLGMAGRQ